MQTFLPYPNYVESARVLDNKRLGKQRVEVIQILNALLGKSKGWVNHPATKMWRGYECSLSVYGDIVCDEWRFRGFKDTCQSKLDKLRIGFSLDNFDPFDHKPKWVGDPEFHLRHQANLLRKDFNHYSKYFGTVINPYLNYKWPVK